MPEYYGFLESIADRSALNPDEGPPRSLYDAVRTQIFLLLNTRQGAVPHLPRYGLPDLNAIYKGYPESLHSLGKQIASVISEYEPRLINGTVELQTAGDKMFEAVFLIKGYLEDEGKGREKVVFKVTIGQNGKVNMAD